MNVTKFILSVLTFAFFLFNGNANAQLSVNATGEVNIGTTSGTTYKLRVYNNDETYSMNLSNVFNTTSYKYGVYNYVSSTGTGGRYGIYNTTYANSASTAYVRGLYNYVYNSGSGNTYGSNIVVSSAGTGTKYGVYSSIGTGTGYAGYFVGDVLVDGSFTINLMSPTPNQTQKAAPLTSVTDRIKGLNTIAFANKADETQYTFDVASLKKAFPELVKDVVRPADEIVAEEEGAAPTAISKETTIATVDYSSLVPVLVEAIKEQQAQIEMLEVKIKQLEK